MRKLFVAIAAITVLFSACDNGPKYKVTGKINGLTNEKVYLSKVEDNKLVKLDSTSLAEGQFVFEGKVASPEMYFVQVDGKPGAIKFFVENAPITITADAKKMNEAKVTGSKNQDVMTAYRAAMKPFMDKGQELRKAYMTNKAAMDKASKELKKAKYRKTKAKLKKEIKKYEAELEKIKEEFYGMGDKQEATTKEFVKKNSSTVAGAALAANLASGMELKDLEKLYASLTGDAKTCKYGKEISDLIAKQKSLAPGNPSPTFNYDNFKGGKTSLESLKGKVVYIDVWATWCGPCRGELPHLQKVEKAYHGKNIAFVSISVDKNVEAWKKMVKDKNLGGIQLHADKAFSSKFVKDYGINGIPRFILLDKEGKIVNADAPRPSNKNLKKLLDETLAK